MDKTSKLLLLFLLVQTIPKTCAHFYIEGYLGGAKAHTKISPFITDGNYCVQNLTAKFGCTLRQQLPSSMTGGFKMGWWPRHQTQAHRAPAWYEYFGLYLDTRVSNFECNLQTIPVCVCYNNGSATAFGTTDISLVNKGPLIILAGMVALRWGLLATDAIPFGRLQPYLALGPAGMFMRQKPCLTIFPHETDGDHMTVLTTRTCTISPQRQWTRSICCACDAGVRYLASRHVFCDGIFSYRFSPIRFSSGCVPQLYLKQRYHFYSVNIGVGYEF